MMRNRPLYVALAGIVLLWPVARASAQAARPDSLALARQYTAWFYTAQFDSLVAHHSADGRADPGLRASLEEALGELTARAGTETAVIEEKFVMRQKRRQYWRTARFSSYDEPLLLRWVLSPEGEITGRGLGPLSQAPPIDP